MEYGERNSSFAAVNKKLLALCQFYGIADDAESIRDTLKKIAAQQFYKVYMRLGYNSGIMQGLNF